MSINISGKSRNFPRAIAVVLGAILTAPITYAIPSNKIVLVPPADLPVLARQSGEAMFLHDTRDGRTLLYVEQRQGAQLAIFDVTDPAHVKGAGSAQLDAEGPFDFVASLGERAELVRFRKGQGEAVLELRKVPTLKKVQGLELQRSTKMSSDGTAELTTPVVDLAMAPTARDYQVLQSGRLQDERGIEVKQVRQEATKPDTGTTFLLAEKGLYIIRRPALESEVHSLESEVHLNTGG
jgi:hypothetical protein